MSATVGLGVEDGLHANSIVVSGNLDIPSSNGTDFCIDAQYAKVLSDDAGYAGPNEQLQILAALNGYVDDNHSVRLGGSVAVDMPRVNAQFNPSDIVVNGQVDAPVDDGKRISASLGYTYDFAKNPAYSGLHGQIVFSVLNHGERNVFETSVSTSGTFHFIDKEVKISDGWFEILTGDTADRFSVVAA